MECLTFRDGGKHMNKKALFHAILAILFMGVAVLLNIVDFIRLPTFVNMGFLVLGFFFGGLAANYTRKGGTK